MTPQINQSTHTVHQGRWLSCIVLIVCMISKSTIIQTNKYTRENGICRGLQNGDLNENVHCGKNDSKRELKSVLECSDDPCECNGRSGGYAKHLLGRRDRPNKSPLAATWVGRH